MAEAAKLLNIKYDTLKKYAIEYECFKPNPAGKGMPGESKYQNTLQEIFEGCCPNYQTHKLKLRMIKTGVKEHECESCKVSTWLEEPIPLELHHKNGNPKDNSYDNLQILCPNCHARTDNYRAKNMKKKSSLPQLVDGIDLESIS